MWTYIDTRRVLSHAEHVDTMVERLLDERGLLAPGNEY
jgi:hypothetical protein